MLRSQKYRRCKTSRGDGGEQREQSSYHQYGLNVTLKKYLPMTARQTIPAPVLF
jgi:hypothetical protein